MEHYTDIIKRNSKEIAKINAQRRLWLILSSVVYVVVILIIFVLDSNASRCIWWVLGSMGLLITINWWYWTMRVINTMIAHKRMENEILCGIITELKAIRVDLL